jgi:hypothetical protein
MEAHQPWDSGWRLDSRVRHDGRDRGLPTRRNAALADRRRHGGRRRSVRRVLPATATCLARRRSRGASPPNGVSDLQAELPPWARLLPPRRQRPRDDDIEHGATGQSGRHLPNVHPGVRSGCAEMSRRRRLACPRSRLPDDLSGRLWARRRREDLPAMWDTHTPAEPLLRGRRDRASSFALNR